MATTFALPHDNHLRKENPPRVGDRVVSLCVFVWQLERLRKLHISPRKDIHQKEKKSGLPCCSPRQSHHRPVLPVQPAGCRNKPYHVKPSTKNLSSPDNSLNYHLRGLNPTDCLGVQTQCGRRTVNQTLPPHTRTTTSNN